MQISEEELSQESARLSAILPELEYRVNRLNDALDNRVFGMISEGKLTPEMALAFWYERASRAGLVKGLKTRAAVNGQAGKELK